ncbi:MAG: hypothetical protein US53_C0014G0008 [Candidatus Woesebacteria bacterium GW2011_GWA1_37_7]|uniref:Uncharacterized protein n=1 Tax=Candidatus Woesebacteria bacterium GW2011_GWA1_37_7 TaxID=1618545 RepID=A0A0G0H322_9BACT|nr:MAG: hypothetical protein US53_C0014G0008 [Candidatus Woesebacteria bacterium GW2011_GWA1_37_7]
MENYFSNQFQNMQVEKIYRAYAISDVPNQRHLSESFLQILHTRKYFKILTLIRKIKAVKLIIP